MRGRLYVELHEIDESRPSGNCNCPGLTKLRESIFLIAGSRERERLHIVLRLCELLGTSVSDRFDGSDNIGIGAAAADIAAHRLPDVVVIWPNRFAQQRRSRHDLSGRAVSTLKSIMLHKCRLNRMQP